MRQDLLEWVRQYCNQNFYGEAEPWEDEEEYEVGDLVIGENSHVFVALTDHTAADDPPPDNVTDWEYTETTLPGGVRVFLTKAEEYFAAQGGISSESLGDYSISYETDIPMGMLKLLPKRVRFT